MYNVQVRIKLSIQKDSKNILSSGRDLCGVLAIEKTEKGSSMQAVSCLFPRMAAAKEDLWVMTMMMVMIYIYNDEVYVCLCVCHVFAYFDFPQPS